MVKKQKIQLNGIYLSFILLLIMFIVTGCTKQVVCNEPYILMGTGCCLDVNNNSICDESDLQVEENITVEDIVEVQKIEESEELKNLKLNLKNAGYVNFFIIEGVNDKGSYIHILDGDGETRESFTPVRFAVENFPKKDNYIISSFDESSGFSMVFILNKENAILDKEDKKIDIFTFSGFKNNWCFEDQNRNKICELSSEELNFKLSDEAIALLEFRNVKMLKEVVSFEGTGYTKTSLFTAKSGHTKIEFSYFTETPDYASMSIYVYPVGRQAYLTQGSIEGAGCTDIFCFQKGKTYLYEVGTFYIDVNVANVDTWYVRVIEER